MAVSSAIIIKPPTNSAAYELPADQRCDDDPKFEDQIGRGELEGHRRDKIGPIDLANATAA
jgi:hypothetical protein